MTPLAKRIVAGILALFLAAPLALAQRSYSQAELEQMLAPVALYPDPLLSQVLMAATRPQQVAEAARWSRFNPGLQGDEALRAVQYESWDPSVKSLVAFPQLLARMDEKLEWTRALGEAFVVQEPQVMETVQGLRHRAQVAGYLQANGHIIVQQQGQAILVQPSNPQYVIVYHRTVVVNRNPGVQSAHARAMPPISYHARFPAPHFKRIGTPTWTRSPSSPVRAAASARPLRSRF